MSLTVHQLIVLDSYVSVNQRLYPVFLSKITKYNSPDEELNRGLKITNP